LHQARKWSISGDFPAQTKHQEEKEKPTLYNMPVLRKERMNLITYM
jgi:hypothetical protein